MKSLGVILVCFALGIGIVCDLYPDPNLPEPIIGLAFYFFIIGMYLIIMDETYYNCRVPKMRNPPAPPKKCICNDISKHSPGGRCEACHSKRKDGGSNFVFE